MPAKARAAVLAADSTKICFEGGADTIPAPEKKKARRSGPGASSHRRNGRPLNSDLRRARKRRASVGVRQEQQQVSCQTRGLGLLECAPTGIGRANLSCTTTTSSSSAAATPAPK